MTDYPILTRLVNVFPALAGGNFSHERTTLRPDTEDVQCSIHVTFVRFATARANPMSYSKRAHTFRTAVGDNPTARARLGSPSFVGFNISSPVPSGFVAELIAQDRPAYVRDGFGHPRFCKFGRADVADNDQFVFPSYLCGPLVKMVPPRVGNLRVDRFNAGFVPGALSFGQRCFMFSIVAQCRDFGAVRERSKALQTEINAYLSRPRGQAIFNFTLKRDVPATARVLHESTKPKITLKVSGIPEAKSSLEVNNKSAVDFHGTRTKWHPAQCALRPSARPESWTTLLRRPRYNELSTDCTNGVRVQAKHTTGARSQIDQIKSRWPMNITASLATRFCFSLNLATVIPHLIARSRVALEIFASRRVFDAEFISEDHFRNMGVAHG